CATTRRLNASREFAHHADEAIGKSEDDGDQRDPNDELPNVGQAPGEMGARNFDAERSDNGASDRATTSQGDHDDQSSPEGEAGIFGRSDPTKGSVSEAGQRSDDGRDDQDNDAIARRIYAEIGATLVIVA